MFRKVRKKANEISASLAKDLIKKSRRGILAVNGDNGYPYAIPINYLYEEESQKIFFHGSKVGHKVDAIKNSDKVCFTVYGNEQIKEEAWAPYLQSAIVFGRCRLIEDEDGAMKVLKDFAMKYYPSESLVETEMKKAAKATQMFEITIEHISGKEVQEK